MSEQSPVSAPTSNAHELPIGHLFSVLWRGRWIIVLTTILAVVAGFMHVRNRGVVWRASARLWVERSGPAILNGESFLMMGSDSYYYTNTQAELIRSTPILTKALDREAVRRSRIFDNVSNRLTWLRRALDVDVGKKDDLITVSLSSPHRAEACVLVNAVVEAYKEFHSEQKRNTAAEVLKHLTAEKDKHDGILAGHLDALTEFRKANSGVGPDRSGLTFASDQLKRVNEQLFLATMEAIEAEAAWNTAKDASKSTGLARSIMRMQSRGDQASIPEASSIDAMRLRELQKQRDRLSSELVDDFPRIKALDKQIAKLEQQIRQREEALVQAWVSGLRRRYTNAKAKRDTLATAASKGKSELASLEAKDAEYLKLQSALKRTESWLETLDARIREININEVDKTSLMVQVLDPARSSTAIASSGKNSTIALALIIGILFGCGLAWLRGLIDQRLRSAEDATEAVQLPILGVLPRASMTKSEEALDEIARWNLKKPMAEAARSLRTAVYFGLPEGEGRVIQVTSPDPGDGKSMISAKLAIAMAQAGQRTVIVDADMRKPRQAQRFHLDNNVGVSNVLTGDQKLAAAVQPTQLDNLTVLASGPVPPNPAELLNSASFERLLAALSEEYDRVIVDSPPVLPVADARIIAAKTEVSVLVLRVDRSTRRRATAARDALTSTGAKLLGIVLNDMPKGIGYGYANYGRRYGYGYGYSDGYGDKPDRPRRVRRTKEAS